MTSPNSEPLRQPPSPEAIEALARLRAAAQSDADAEVQAAAAARRLGFFLAMAFLAPLFFMLAWNWGISEFIQRAGGDDFNINYAIAFFALVFVRLLAINVRGHRVD